MNVPVKAHPLKVDSHNGTESPQIARTEDVNSNSNQHSTFHDLMLKDVVLKGLSDADFVRPSPIQLKAIPTGRCGVDMIVQAKSGTGKTCVFSVVALEAVRPNVPSLQVLVVAPTREIAIQGWQCIVALGKHVSGLKSECFIGGIAVSDDAPRLKSCHIAVGTVGRLKQLIEMNLLRTTHLRLVILDEADDIYSSQNDDLLAIFDSLPAAKQVIALSATYPPNLLRNLIESIMKEPTLLRLNVSDPALLGIRQYFKVITSDEAAISSSNEDLRNAEPIFRAKCAYLLSFLSKVLVNQCLIFSNAREHAKALALTLNKADYQCTYISGDQEQARRLFAYEQLKRFQCRILISTDLTSRGIDAEHVNLVVNLDMPLRADTYLHRIGRAGRFGSYGAALSLVSVDEYDRLRSFERSCNTQVKPVPDLEEIPMDLLEQTHAVSNVQLAEQFVDSRKLAVADLQSQELLDSLNDDPLAGTNGEAMSKENGNETLYYSCSDSLASPSFRSKTNTATTESSAQSSGQFDVENESKPVKNLAPNKKGVTFFGGQQVADTWKRLARDSSEEREIFGTDALNNGHGEVFDHVLNHVKGKIERRKAARRPHKRAQSSKDNAAASTLPLRNVNPEIVVEDLTKSKDEDSKGRSNEPESSHAMNQLCPNTIDADSKSTSTSASTPTVVAQLPGAEDSPRPGDCEKLAAADEANDVPVVTSEVEALSKTLKSLTLIPPASLSSSSSSSSPSSKNVTSYQEINYLVGKLQRGEVALDSADVQLSAIPSVLTDPKQIAIDDLIKTKLLNPENQTIQLNDMFHLTADQSLFEAERSKYRESYFAARTGKRLEEKLSSDLAVSSVVKDEISEKVEDDPAVGSSTVNEKNDHVPAKTVEKKTKAKGKNKPQPVRFDLGIGAFLTHDRPVEEPRPAAVKSKSRRHRDTAWKQSASRTDFLCDFEAIVSACAPTPSDLPVGTVSSELPTTNGVILKHLRCASTKNSNEGSNEGSDEGSGKGSDDLMGDQLSNGSTGTNIEEVVDDEDDEFCMVCWYERQFEENCPFC